MFERVSRLASRLFGLIILPAQVPGDPVDLGQDLFSNPWRTIRSWKPETIKALLWQLVTHQKLTLPRDSQLERLNTSRTKFLSRGWSLCPVRTMDGVELDAVIKAPTNARVAPRYVLFVGGNSQKYEDWLPYFQLYADDSELGFLCFNFRGVARSEGTVTCPEDMVTDVRAAFEHLVAVGVQPHHILIHGFSLGGAIST